MTHRILTFLLCFCLAAPMATAAPETYRLNAATSKVEFIFTLEGTPQSGRMPVAAADMQIDLEQISASRVAVTLNARAVKTGFIFATQALKAPDMLHTAQFPAISFRSTDIRGTPSAATVTGNLTIRNVTRPVTLRAELFRQSGAEADSLDNLAILLTGSVSRAAFGLTGYPKLVDDRIDLRILAQIDK